MQNEIEKEYAILKKKYTLPEYKELDFEFDISSIDHVNFLLKKICERMHEKIYSLVGVLEELLQPDDSLKSLHELRFLDDADKKSIYEAYKQLMVYSRELVILSLVADEKKQAEFINAISDEWKDLKKDLAVIFEKMRDSWEIETDIKEDLGYLG